MARYRIEKKTTGVDIELTEVGDKRQALLSAFNECAEGRCACPTNEYEKVASMTVEDGKDRIDIKLVAKPDGELQVSEIAYCLVHTIKTSAKEVTTMGFARWMAGGWGRTARIVAGLTLIAFGLYVQSAWGIVIAVVGAVPLVAGVFNFCVFAPLFGGPFNGRRVAA